MRIGWRTDNPPDEDEEYLVQYVGGGMDVAHWTNVMYFGGNPITTDWRWSGIQQYAKVEAWRLLPESYIPSKECVCEVEEEKCQ